MTPDRLQLRPLEAADEAEFTAAQRSMTPTDFDFGLGFDAEQPWSSYLTALEAARTGSELSGGRVPSTFLVADVAGTIVGRASIRHALNDFLAREGGHIGYAVLPAHRGRGYATEMLRQSLTVARWVGVNRVLVTCDDDNVASATVIERCGGVMESTVIGRDGRTKRRYWIS